MSNDTFWKPEPRKPFKDWRMYAMLIPIIVSATGFFVSGVFAFAFSDIAVIRENAQSWLVIASSGLIIWGAELNTPGTVIEVFRKIIRKKANGWDISSLVVSGIGTTINILVTFASRTKLSPAWRDLVLNWGPLLAGFAVACDYYGGLVELGFLFGMYEVRMEMWLVERRAFDEETGQGSSVLAKVIAKVAVLERQIEISGYPVVTKAEWAGFIAGLSGSNGSEPETMAEARAFLAERERQLPSGRTAMRWGLKVEKPAAS